VLCRVSEEEQSVAHHDEASNGILGLELWKTDGTAAQTGMMQDIALGAGSSTPHGFTRAGNYVYFSADDNVTGRELWVLPEFAANLPPQAFDGIGRNHDGAGPAIHKRPVSEEQRRVANPMAEELPGYYRLPMPAADVA
jgi:ELWxxDGT repeat protein